MGMCPILGYIIVSTILTLFFGGLVFAICNIVYECFFKKAEPPKNSFGDGGK